MIHHLLDFGADPTRKALFYQQLLCGHHLWEEATAIDLAKKASSAFGTRSAAKVVDLLEHARDVEQWDGYSVVKKLEIMCGIQ